FRRAFFVAFLRAAILGFTPLVRLLDTHGLCVSRATRSRSPTLSLGRDSLGSPPIGPLDTPLEGNLPSFSPETAGLEQLLRLTLPLSFLVRQDTIAKKSR